MIQLHAWPFPVTVTGNLLGGAPGELIVGAQDLDEAQPMLTGVVATFADLGAVGGLSGAALPLNSSHVTFSDAEHPSKRETALVWPISSIAIDPRSLTLLLNMLEGVDEGTNLVMLNTTGVDCLKDLAANDYPRLTAQVGFKFNAQLLGRNAAVEVIFRHPPPASAHGPIVNAVETWANAGMTGAFRYAGEPAASSVVPLLEDPRFVLDALTFLVEGLSADFAAFDVLVNILAWVSLNIAEIESVNIE